MSNEGSNSRGAFLTSEWIEFQKQLYASEEKIEKQFSKDWKNKKHEFQMAGNKVVYPYCHGNEDEAANPETTGGGSKPGRPPPAHYKLYTGQGARSLLTNEGGTQVNRWLRSPRADAALDDATKNQLRGRLSKSGKQDRLTKFSKSQQFKGCMYQSDLPGKSGSSGKGGGKGGGRNSRVGSRAGSRVGSRAGSRVGSRASRNISSRASNVSIVSTSSTYVIGSKTSHAFNIIAERLDNRVGLSLCKHQLFLKNGFRKFAIDGSNHISLQDMRLFVVRALGCGAGAVNLSHLSSPFREDSKDGVERMNFTKMMAAYMQHAKSSKKQSATNF